MIKGILNGLMSMISGLFEWLLEKVVQWVIAPLLMFLINLVMYTCSTLLYSLGVFLLSLVDFVEVLFRILAGLPSNKASITLGGGDAKPNPFTGQNGESDLLLQVLMQNEVRDVFLSLCIVGLFLLVITTIFQIIKVEYTTEGAKNAKGPILGKAFKGICNMVLIPVLVVFGVFLGNQVLDLLDKATKSNQKATIASLIFTTSITNAFYKKDYAKMPLTHTDLLSGGIVSLIGNIVPIVSNAFRSNDENQNDIQYMYSIEEREAILQYFEDSAEMNYKEGTNGDKVEGTKKHLVEFYKKDTYVHTYSEPAIVTSYFDIARINYVLLFFGGVFALKTLYFAAFGMVVRLYQCAMLFIISPMVIGMTPINEGNMGKWRSKFIGSCLSAYGVVVALNLFFILVKIFLKIELKFTGNNLNVVNVIGNLSGPFMEGILRIIFVLSGCLMIEKFSKEIGGYFGAEDALSTGKEMSNAVTDQAMKGVKFAAAVGSGGAGLAMKMGKGVAKAGAGAVRGWKAAGASGENRGKGLVKGAFGMKFDDSAAKKNADKLGKEKANAVKEKAGLEEQMGYLDADDAKMQSLQRKESTKGVGLTPEEDKELRKLQSKANVRKKQRSDLESKIKKKDNHIKGLDNDIKENDEKLNTIHAGGSHDGVKGLALDTLKDAGMGIKNGALNKLKAVGDRSIQFAGFLAGARSTAMKDLMPKPFKEMGSFYKGAVDTSAKANEEVAAAQKAIDTRKEDKLKESINNLAALPIFLKNKAQEQKVAKMMIEEAKIMNTNLENQADTILKNMNEARTQMANTTNENEQASLMQMINHYKQQLTGLGVGLDQIKGGKDTEYKIAGDFKFGINPEGIEKAFKNALKGGKGSLSEAGMKQLMQEMLAGQSADQAKQIEAIIQKVISKINSAGH